MSPAAGRTARRSPGAPRPDALVPVLLLAAVFCACAPLPQIVVLEDPLSAEEHLALGVAYERRGELEPAAREYERALKKDRASFRARLNLGNVRLAEKRFGDARAEYLRALGLRAGDPEATNNLAWAAILSGEGREGALRRLDDVLAARAAAAPADGLTPVLLDTRGVLLGSLGRRAEAEEALARAEAACLAGRAAPGAPPSAAAGGAGQPPPCPDSVLEEIRRHRRELGASPSR